MAFIAHPLPTFRLSSRTHRCPQMTLKVIVTGAGGRSGRLVFQKLHASNDFEATGLVRNRARAAEAIGSDKGLVEGDVTDSTTLKPAFDGKDALVVLTSAMPIMAEPVADAPPAPPAMTYADGGMPEDVDWIGSRNQIDAAKAAGISHVVFIGSMGSTDDNHPLNRIGNGNILRYKRKAELYLIDSGIPYTIVNPGGLTNDVEGEREIVAGRNDEFFTIFGSNSCSIPRGDVARVVVAALTAPEAKNKAMDLVARPPGDGKVTTDPSPLFVQTAPGL